MREPSGLYRFRTPLLGSVAAALVLAAGAIAIPAAGSFAGPSPLVQGADVGCSPGAGGSVGSDDSAGAPCGPSEGANKKRTKKRTDKRTKTSGKTSKTRTKTHSTTSKTAKPTTSRTRTSKTSTTGKTSKTRTSKTSRTTKPTPTSTSTRPTSKRPTSRTTSPTTTSPATVLAATDFEDGTEQTWRGGNLNVTEVAAHTGTWGLQVGGLDKGQQTQLTVGVTDTSSWYQATVWLAVPDKSHTTAVCPLGKGGGSSTGDKVTLAAPGTEASQGKGVLAVSSTWASVDLMFKPYSSDSTVTIALTGTKSGPDLLYVDDVVIVKVAAPRTTSTKGSHGTAAAASGDVVDAPASEAADEAANEGGDGECAAASPSAAGLGGLTDRARRVATAAAVLARHGVETTS